MYEDNNDIINLLMNRRSHRKYLNKNIYQKNRRDL